MLKLYRGLLDIIIFQSRMMDEQFTQHIRAFNDGDTNENNFGVKGFWNFLLEIVCVFFVKSFVVVGTSLFVGLALLFFPLYAIKMAVVNVLNHRADPFENEVVVENVHK